MVSNELMIKFPNFHTKIFIDQKFCNKFGNIVKKNLFCQNNTTVVIITDEEVFNLFAVEVKQSFYTLSIKEYKMEHNFEIKISQENTFNLVEISDKNEDSLKEAIKSIYTKFKFSY